ncbi:MAG: elongation factor P [Candidatus Pacebacteria bacterium]|jgi:elongation factor P|nr:elongation factor P [Candidatus Paceibacterota bacterium]
MLEYNEIKTGKIIVFEDEPYEIQENHVARTQQRKPQNQVKMRNLITGRAVTMAFHASDKAEEAEIAKKDVKFLYQNKGEYWFSDPADPKNRFQLPESLIGDAKRFLKDNMIVLALIWEYEDEEKTIGIKLPIKVELVVKEAPPNMKGNTASGGGKVAVLENGTSITVPFFIEAGETIRINTETGEYVERVS